MQQLLPRQCPHEEASQHYDAAKSKGCVSNAEEVLYIALDQKVIADGHLTFKAFPSEKLRDSEASIDRISYSNPGQVDAFIIQPACARGKTCHGAAKADVAVIRELKAESLDGKTLCYAFCVIDKVELGDADSHSVIAFSENIDELSSNPTKIGMIKKIVRGELAKRFGPIGSVASHFI